MRDYTRIYTDGAWVKPLDGKIIDVINPATERPAGHITLCTAADVDRAVEAARKAFITFSRSSRQERLDLLSSILGVYAKRQDDLADVLTEELGAPKKFAKEMQVGAGLWHLQTAIAILKDVYIPRIQRGNTYFAANVLGATGLSLTALAHFFEDGRWGSPFENDHRRTESHPGGQALHPHAGGTISIDHTGNWSTRSQNLLQA